MILHFPHDLAYVLKQSDLSFRQFNSICMNTRLHTIHKYTFPPSSAEAAAAELVKLYVQKGHNQVACSRFLKKAPITAICVCQPLGQGFTTTTTFPPSPPFPPRQGVSHAGACSICGPLHATKLRPQMGRDQGRLILYLPKPLTKLLLHFSTFCFHGSCMILPQNPNFCR